jgi:hypothetical protein
MLLSGALSILAKRQDFEDARLERISMIVSRYLWRQTCVSAEVPKIGVRSSAIALNKHSIWKQPGTEASFHLT